MGAQRGLVEEIGHGAAQVVGHGFHHRVALGVDGAGVKGVGSVVDAQEAGGLLEGLGAEAGDFAQFGAGAEGAVGNAMGHDVGGQLRTQPRHIGE